jgi:hypothetical protein
MLTSFCNCSANLELRLVILHDLREQIDAPFSDGGYFLRQWLECPTVYDAAGLFESDARAKGGDSQAARNLSHQTGREPSSVASALHCNCSGSFCSSLSFIHTQNISMIKTAFLLSPDVSEVRFPV